MAGRSSRLIFGACAIISGVAAMFGMNALPVMAAENAGEEVTVGEDIGTGVGADAGISAGESDDADAGSQTVGNQASTCFCCVGAPDSTDAGSQTVENQASTCFCCVGAPDSTDTDSQTVENVAVDNPDGDVLAGNITDSKPQTLPSLGESIAVAIFGGIALALVIYDIRN